MLLIKPGLKESRANTKVKVLTLMCALALLSKPSVVCLVQSGPSGIRTFKRSKHRRRWARLRKTKKSNKQSEYSTRNILKPILRQIIICTLFSLWPCYTPTSISASAGMPTDFQPAISVVLYSYQPLQIIIPNDNLCQRLFHFSLPHKLSQLY